MPVTVQALAAVFSIYSVGKEEIPKLVKAIWETVPDSAKERYSKEACVAEYAPAYLEAKGYKRKMPEVKVTRGDMPEELKNRYSLLMVGEKYKLEDHNTNIKITDTVNTWNDDYVYVVDNKKQFRLSGSLGIVEGAEYELLSKDPVLVFAGPINDVTQKCSIANITAQIDDYKQFESYMNKNKLEISASDLWFIYDTWNWNMQHRKPFTLHDVFNQAVEFVPFNGNPAGAMHGEKVQSFVISLLTGSPNIAMWVKCEDGGANMHLHLNDGDYAIYDGDMPLIDKYEKRCAGEDL